MLIFRVCGRTDDDSCPLLNVMWKITSDTSPNSCSPAKQFGGVWEPGDMPVLAAQAPIKVHERLEKSEMVAEDTKSQVPGIP